MSSPPVAVPHEHKGKACPFSESHGWCRVKTDSRSPCPALNVLANHGHLPRDGRNISIYDLIVGLQAGYNLSFLLASFLSIVGFFLLQKFTIISLEEIGAHNKIEHDASLVHADADPGQDFAPIEVHKDLVELLVHDADDTAAGGAGSGEERKTVLIKPHHVARARVRREKQSERLDGFHAEIARGEMGIILGVLEKRVGPGDDNVGVPVEWMKEWIGEERLPQGWRPTHVQGFFDTVKRSKAIREAMEEYKKAENQERRDL